MKNKYFQIFIGFVIAVIFISLSLRQVSVSEVADEISKISLWWIFPYFFVVLISNLARAERWKLLLDDETGRRNSRLSLLSGIMYGYIGNLLIPRAGELLRAVYASNRTQIESTKLFGTIILERIIDLLMMTIMLLVTFILLVNDPAILQQLFGSEGAQYIRYLTSGTGLLAFLIMSIIALVTLFYLRTRHKAKADEQMIVSETISAGQSGQNPSAPEDTDRPSRDFEEEQKTAKANHTSEKSIISKFKLWGKDFIRGLISLRKLNNWPMFVFYTLVIWFTYIVTSLLPFYGFGFHEVYGFGWEQAFVITVIGAVGVTLPSPGGVGTYHYMVQTGLLVLYGVPAAVGLGYATIGHFINVMCLIVISIILYLVNHKIDNKQTENTIPFSRLFR